MPELSDVVQTSITATSATPSVPGFGKPLLLAQDTPAGFTERYREYASDTDAVTDGFVSGGPTILGLQKAFAQSPRPPLVGVGRRALKTTQSIKFTCGSAVEGDVYSCDVYVGATKTTITRTVPAASNTTAEATAIAALFDAISGVTSSAVAAVITNTATAGAGTLIRYANWTVNGARSTNFTFLDNSADPGIATDLAAIKAENNSWYGLALDSCSKAETVAAAAWAESNKKLMPQQSSDSGCIDSGSSTDTMAAVQTSAYDYTAILYNGNDSQAWAGLAWMSKRFASSPTPGDDTWNGNQLASVAADVLSETEFATVGSKNGTAYVTVDSVNYTLAGGVSTSKSGGKSGSGEFLDIRRFLDWQDAEMQVAVFIALNPGTGKKIPFTDRGISLVEGALSGVLVQGVNAGGYEDGSTLISAPNAADVSASDRANRKLSGIAWSAELAGAIHLVVVEGTVTT